MVHQKEECPDEVDACEALHESVGGLMHKVWNAMGCEELEAVKTAGLDMSADGKLTGKHDEELSALSS